MRSLTKFFVLLAALGSAQAAEPIQLGETVLVQSGTLNEQRTIRVYKPAGYDQSPEVRYPVLYLLDGSAHFLHTAGTVEFLARNGFMPQVLIVAVENTDRTRDLTPSKADLKGPGGESVSFPTAGGADSFLKFLETELRPEIERSYRTLPYRILAGHSFGGLFALHVLFTRPDAFDAYLAVSPTLNWDDRWLFKKAEALFAARPDLKKRLYVTVGGEEADLVEHFAALRKLFDQHKSDGFVWDGQVLENEDHGSVVLLSHYHGLRKIFEGWRPPQNLREAGLEGLQAHYRKLGESFGFEIPVPENLINQLGYGALGANEMDKAVAIFEQNVKAYPESANVYDSLGEALEKSGRLEEALKSYEKAFAAAEKHKDPRVQLFKQNRDRLAKTLAERADAGASASGGAPATAGSSKRP